MSPLEFSEGALLIDWPCYWREQFQLVMLFSITACTFFCISNLRVLVLSIHSMAASTDTVYSRMQRCQHGTVPE